METPKSGALCDMLWSDPLGEDTAQDILGDPEIMEEWYGVDFEPNPDRGCGQVFGYSALNKFLEANKVRSSYDVCVCVCVCTCLCVCVFCVFFLLLSLSFACLPVCSLCVFARCVRGVFVGLCVCVFSFCLVS
jgi:hypothetical protein